QETVSAKGRIAVEFRLVRRLLEGLHNVRRRRQIGIALPQIDHIVPRLDLGGHLSHQPGKKLLGKPPEHIRRLKPHLPTSHPQTLLMLMLNVEGESVKRMLHLKLRCPGQKTQTKEKQN